MKKCNIKTNDNSTSTNKYDQAKKGQVITILPLTFLINAVQYVCGKNETPYYSSKKGRQIYERILEAERVCAFDKLGRLYGEEDEEMNNTLNLLANYPTVADTEPESYELAEEVHNIQLDDLVFRVNQMWHETVENMIQRYTAYAEEHNIDESCRDEMWNQGWYRYLYSIHGDLNYFLHDEHLSLETREQLAEELIRGAKEDFLWFLNMVKEEWDRIHQSEIIVEV
ncbi:Plasmodium exported protein, unknown function [Plasmodium malariae]|uniref:Uncharacterized protein n=1 Tax=Plasmodium malariae TaxID=5858 RepID=A0A1A8X2M5_PLAMA|nr:Plasmodium exported protein, unknown function [Plasmodium malariae]